MCLLAVMHNPAYNPAYTGGGSFTDPAVNAPYGQFQPVPCAPQYPKYPTPEYAPPPYAPPQPPSPAPVTTGKYAQPMSTPYQQPPGPAPPYYGGAPLQQPQQQQQQQVVVVNNQQSRPVIVQTQSFCCHMVLACCVMWCCNPLFGLTAFIIAGKFFLQTLSCTLYTVRVKKSPPCGLWFSDIFHKRLRILNQFLHAYCTFLSTIDYKFLFSYPQL